jgi:hypothetical protein
MPYWAVVIIIVVLAVVYYTTSSYAREKRRGSVAEAFTTIPNFHANQVFVDVRGAVAIGVDDRGRRVAIAQKHQQPRVRTLSFAQIASVEMVQNNAVIARAAKGDRPPAAPADGLLFGSTTPGSLFGSTASGERSTRNGQDLGPLTSVGVRVTLDDSMDGGLVVRFYEGKEVGRESVTGENALAQARTCYAALEIAMRKATLAPRPSATGAAGAPLTRAGNDPD